MLPAAARAAIDADTPKLTESLAKGVAINHMHRAENYVDQVFRAVSTGFPPGLSYLGCRRLTPQERFHELTKARNSRRTYDIAPSSLYLVEYKFAFKEDAENPNNHEKPKEFSRILSIPYVGEAGTMYLNGSHWVVSPVLADRVFSIGQDTVFVRIVKARLTFNRTQYAYDINTTAMKQLENQLIVWCNVYNEDTKVRNRNITCRSTMTHYLFGKYGFHGAFHKFLGITPVVGKDEVNEDNYPKSEWIICTSRGRAPRGVRTGANGRGYYQPTEIRVAIRKEDYTNTAKQFVAGFFYVVDHYPDRMLAEYVNDLNTWKVLLGRVIWDEAPTIGRALADIDEHYRSLDDYLDTLSEIKLAQLGFPVKNIYELFAVIIRNFNDWMAEAPDRVATMYDKELSILPFVCYCYIDQFNKLVYRLKSNRQRALSANRQRSLTFNSVQELFSKFLRSGLIYSLYRECGLLSPVSTSGDCMALRLTNILVAQDASNRAKARPRPMLTNPAKQLHHSIAEVGQYSAMPKSAPDGRQRINLCVKVDETGLILRDPNLAPLLQEVAKQIGR